MAWTTLADALKSAIAQGQIAAETGVGAPDPAILAKSKRTPTEAGAKSMGEPLPTVIRDANRCSPAHPKGARPTLGAGRHMFVVIDGGRREAWEEEASPPASVSRSNGRENRARKLKLVVVR